jgi:hypothetical protein
MRESLFRNDIDHLATRIQPYSGKRKKFNISYGVVFVTFINYYYDNQIKGKDTGGHAARKEETRNAQQKAG